MDKNNAAMNNMNTSNENRKLAKLLNQKNKREALNYLITLCQQNTSYEIYEKILLEQFYYPHAGKFEECYAKNLKLFRDYQYFKPELVSDIRDLNFQLLVSDEEYYKYFPREKRVEKLLFTHPKDVINTRIKVGDKLFLHNYFHFKKIFKMEIESRDEDKIFTWMKEPLYLYYDSLDLFLPYMQCFDLGILLKSERIVFLFGKQELYDCFNNKQATFPDTYPGLNEDDDLVIEIMNFKEAIDEDYRKNYWEAHQYYISLSSQEMYDSLKSGKPRIVFFTSLFSTAIQYFTRDLAKACDRLQIPNHIIIEQDSVHRVTTAEIFEILNDFRPDIFFMINDFRYQHDFLPANMLFFNWAMDPYDQKMSYETAAKTTDRDFILNLWISNKEFLLKRGHPENRIIEGPIVVADAELFREYHLSEEEQSEYGCDICLFSNAGNPREGLKSFLELISGNPRYEILEKIYTAAYEELYRRFYNEDYINSDEEYSEYLKMFYKQYHISEPQEYKEEIIYKFRELVGWQIMRSIPLEWLHEKGYNMKLWGKAWLDHPVLKQYAKGVAGNGEMLAKVIKASKIVLGTNPAASAHPRVFETFLSGGFYMGINVSIEYDYASIRRYMEEDKEIVFFYSKEDLYQKVEYYLKNERHRREIIENAQKKIRSEINYETLLPMAIAEAAQKFARQLNICQDQEVS